MRHRPTEVKAVRELVEQEWEDTDVLAQAILDVLVDVKWKRGGWVVVMVDEASLPRPQLFGPYGTQNQAMKDIGARVVGAHPKARCGVFRVQELDAVAQASDMVLFG